MKQLQVLLFILINVVTTSLYAASGAASTAALPADSTPTILKQPYFNELFDGLNLREAYQPLEFYIRKLERNQKVENKFLKMSKEAFGGDNSLNPLPRILTSAEATELQVGVKQRALALQAFLKDHYSGNRTYAKSGIISESVVKQIIDRAGESKYDGVIDPQGISFMYGPDIIRDNEGSWRVIEDNPGFIGGVGDLKLAYDLIIKKHRSLNQQYELADPMIFYRTLAREYKKKALAHGGKAIIYSTFFVDNEEQRIEDLFAAEGIEMIYPYSDKKISITADGVYLKYKYLKGKPAEKVGYIFLNAEHADLGKSLLNAILENKVGSNYSAGVDFIGDKEFYVYVEDLIRFYLKEEPILKNIPTQKFIDERTGQLKIDLIREVSRKKEDFVIKKVDGRGGDSVWVGAKTPQTQFDEVLREVEINPSEHIVQKYTHLSVLGENIVDLRSISAVFPDRVVVAETPWGRGLPMNGNGKVNLSDKGREVTVLVIKSALGPSAISCEQVLLKEAM